MVEIRREHTRGRANFGWLESKHSFSFGNWYDPTYMGVSDLRVINDDWVRPGAGFDTHGHRDMEIITYVLEGAIEHKDTMGEHQILKAGEVQVMSAGSGVRHSEYNASNADELRFLQIWVIPNEQGGAPRYQQKDFSAQTGVSVLVSPDGRDGSLQIRQDAAIHSVRLNDERQVLKTDSDRAYYLHLIKGELTIKGETLAPGDAATLVGEKELNLHALGEVEALLFDLRAVSH